MPAVGNRLFRITSHPGPESRPGAWDLKVHCDDETGADWAGADEISVDGTADDLPLPHIYDGDSDTGENTDLSARLGFAWYSEHLSSFATMRGAVPNAQAGLGLPVPYDEDVLDLLCAKVDHVQDRLDLRLLLENPAVFTPVPDCEFTEPAFLNELCRRTGCGVLLDLHNLYTNVRTNGVDSAAYLAELELAYVVEIHLAGGSELGGFYTDSHADVTPSEVWRLAYEHLPAMSALRSVIFEFHESSVDRIGVSVIVEELERIHELVAPVAASR